MQLGRGLASLRLGRRYCFPPLQTFRPQLLDPMLLLLGEMLYTLGIKTITNRKDGHRCRRLVSRMRAQNQPNKNNHTESFYPIKCVRP